MIFVTRSGCGKALMSAALVWAGAVALWAQGGTTVSRPQSTTAPRAPSPAPAQSSPVRAQPAGVAAQGTAAPDQTAKYQAWVKQYCISCHNSRTASDRT